MDSAGVLIDSERFEIRRLLGVGGFGVVYEAIDRHYGSVVALKLLHKSDAAQLYRFKQEFRVLAGVVHPNLAMLHELHTHDGRWFFTMELVHGVEFIESLTPKSADSGEVVSEPARAPKPASATVTASRVEEDLAIPKPSGERPFGETVSVELEASTRLLTRKNDPEEPAAERRSAIPKAASSSSVPREKPRFPFSEEQVRARFLQLAEGVRALHAAHVLHRDLKPSNVLVEPGGRVVLLDFGLAKELRPGSESNEVDEALVGTPHYMAPEQFMHAPPAPASDWYGVGVMLYEVLAGRRPFDGPLSLMVRAKMVEDPAPPSRFVDGAPPDLEALCLDLMRRSPAERPSGDEVIRRLRGAPSAAEPLHSHAPDPTHHALVGRDAELRRLRDAFAASREGRATIVHLAGPSGSGKSALVASFLEEARRKHRTLVLTGRCFERESVPYKAMDSLVDALALALHKLPQGERTRAIPAGATSLAKLFPVLQTVPEWPSADGVEGDPKSPQKARWLAFQALKRLLWHLAEERPLVLALDDLQWGDSDSASLLVELLSAPGVPRMLVLLAYRADELRESPFFTELAKLGAGPGSPVEAVHIPVQPLSDDAAIQLAIDLLGGPARADAARAREIAREASNDPFSIEELVRYADLRRARPDEVIGDVSLRGAILSRVHRLGEPSRRLLEVGAVAGCPLPQHLAFAAAGLQDGLSSFTPLRAMNLLRARTVSGQPGFELQHDRLRAAVLDEISKPSLAAHHLALGLALEASGDAEPEVLAFHFHGAGELLKAAAFAERAAESASRSLAFDRAAEHWEHALTWGRGGPGDSDARRRSLLEKRASALADGGRGPEAAALLLRAAEGATREGALDLRRRATEQYLIAGRIDDGFRVLVPLLGEVGLGYPSTTAGAVLATVGLFAKLKWRGLKFDERKEGDVPHEDLVRIDLCSAVSKALTDVDPLRSAVFQLRTLLLSLDAGEASRVAAGLSALGLASALRGRPSSVAEGEDLLARARAIGSRFDDRRLAVTIALNAASLLLVRGQWRRAAEEYDRLGRSLDSVGGFTAERGFVKIASIIALETMGRLVEVDARTAAWHREAVVVGNVFATITATLARHAVLLAADDPAAGRERIREAASSWTQRGMDVQRLYVLRFEAHAALYEGRPVEARARLMARWRSIVLSQQLQIQPSRIDMNLLRAQTAIATAAASPRERSALLAEAAKLAASLEGEVRAEAVGTAELLRAGVASVRGDRDAALRHLLRAETVHEASEMALHVACARRARGALLGGSEGKGLVREAESFMATQGVRRPDRWMRVHLPGFELDSA